MCTHMAAWCVGHVVMKNTVRFAYPQGFFPLGCVNFSSAELQLFGYSLSTRHVLCLCTICSESGLEDGPKTFKVRLWFYKRQLRKGRLVLLS